MRKWYPVRDIIRRSYDRVNYAHVEHCTESIVHPGHVLHRWKPFPFLENVASHSCVADMICIMSTDRPHCRSKKHHFAIRDVLPWIRNRGEKRVGSSKNIYPPAQRDFVVITKANVPRYPLHRVLDFFPYGCGSGNEISDPPDPNLRTSEVL